MPLSAHALTTVQSVRSALAGRDPIPLEHDAEIEALINALSEAVERYCGRHFERRTYVELIAGNDRQYLLLSESPVVSIVSVAVNGAVVSDFQTLPSQDYPGFLQSLLYRESGWPSARPQMVFPPYPHPSADTLNVRVEYTAGWVLPWEAGRDLPYDLERACIELVATAYLNRDKLGLRSQAFEGFSLQFDWWPLHIRQILDRYKRLV